MFNPLPPGEALDDAVGFADIRGANQNTDIVCNGGNSILDQDGLICHSNQPHGIGFTSRIKVTSISGIGDPRCPSSSADAPPPPPSPSPGPPGALNLEDMPWHSTPAIRPQLAQFDAHGGRRLAKSEGKEKHQNATSHMRILQGNFANLDSGDGAWNTPSCSWKYGGIVADMIDRPTHETVALRIYDARTFAVRFPFKFLVSGTFVIFRNFEKKKNIICKAHV